MTNLESLLKNYEKFITPPWPRNLASHQRVWFAVYDPVDERRLRARLGEFELATKRANHSFRLCDITQAFAEWMAATDYREAYFAYPDDLDMVLEGFLDYVVQRVSSVLEEEGLDHDSVVAVYGLGSLFGFTRVSQLVERAADKIPGRLLIFFPGQHENSNYRLLDARDGWNYHAVAITA